jgi:hypothetical protein
MLRWLRLAKHSAVATPPPVPHTHTHTTTLSPSTPLSSSPTLRCFLSRFPRLPSFSHGRPVGSGPSPPSHAHPAPHSLVLPSAFPPGLPIAPALVPAPCVSADVRPCAPAACRTDIEHSPARPSALSLSCQPYVRCCMRAEGDTMLRVCHALHTHDRHLGSSLRRRPSDDLPSAQRSILAEGHASRH